MDVRKILHRKCTELNTYMFLRKQHRQSTYENSTAAFHACKVSQALAEQTQQSCHMEAISLHTLKKVFLLSSSMSLFLS